MIVHGLAVSQRRAFLGKPFVLAWLGFVVIYALAAFAVWLLASVLALQPIGPEPAIFQFLITVTLFPVFAWRFVRVHRSVVRSAAMLKASEQYTQRILTHMSLVLAAGSPGHVGPWAPALYSLPSV